MNNTRVIIEALNEKHVDQLTIWFNTFVDEDSGVVENFHVDPKGEKKYILAAKELIKANRLYSFIAVTQEKVVGKVDVIPMQRYIDKHVAEISFGLLRNNSEAGRMLLETAVKKAVELRIEVLVYYILNRNDYFIKQFLSAGFKKVGAIEKFYKKNGKYYNRIILEKLLI